MAAAKRISGILREIWQEGPPGQAGGPSQVFTTGIRIDPGSLSKVRALLVVDSVVGGVINPAVTADAPNGFLRFAVAFSGNPGVVVTWTLDAQLTHSIQQARDPLAGAYIAVVNGAGVVGLLGNQTLAQTYDFGAVAADQRMVIDTAKGGGIVVEASTAAVTGNGGSFEVRQNAAWSVPMVVRRAGDIVGGPELQFAKARGTIAAPTHVLNNDELGTIDFYGRSGASSVLCSRLVSLAVLVGAGPNFELNTGLDIYTAYLNVPVQVARFKTNGSNGVLAMYGANALVEPAVNNEGYVGSIAAAHVWAGMAAYTINAVSNMCIGGGSVGGGAAATIMLPTGATLPAPQADQVYIGSNDFGFGANHAALAIAAEEPPLSVAGPQNPTWFIPIRYNGISYYLYAEGANA